MGNPWGRSPNLAVPTISLSSLLPLAVPPSSAGILLLPRSSSLLGLLDFAQAIPTFLLRTLLLILQVPAPLGSPPVFALTSPTSTEALLWWKKCS